MTRTSGEIERDAIRERNKIVIEDMSKCYYCESNGLTEQDLFCSNCAFPQRGTQGEMKRFLTNMNNKSQLLYNHKKAVKKAKNILYILAAINLAAGILLGLIIRQDVVVLIGCMIGAVIFFSLALWCKKQPFAAILCGLFVYIVFNVLGAIEDPHTLYQGVILKIVIISGFIYGFKGVKESQKLDEELKLLKSAKDLNSGRVELSEV